LFYAITVLFEVLVVAPAFVRDEVIQGELIAAGYKVHALLGGEMVFVDNRMQASGSLREVHTRCHPLEACELRGFVG